MRDSYEDDAMNGANWIPFEGFLKAGVVFFGQFESFVGHFESSIPKDIVWSDHKSLAD